MPSYVFDLSSPSGRIFSTYILPAGGVPVFYKKREIARVDVPESGLVEMELDPDLIERLTSGRSFIREFTIPDRRGPDGKFMRLVELTVFDLH